MDCGEENIKDKWGGSHDQDQDAGLVDNIKMDIREMGLGGID
jgi:hypothetical protein